MGVVVTVGVAVAVGVFVGVGVLVAVGVGGGGVLSKSAAVYVPTSQTAT